MGPRRRGASGTRAVAIAEQVGHVHRSGDHRFEHAVDLARRIAMLGEEPLGVAELEYRQDEPFRRSHRLAAMDVHSEVRHDAGDVAEEERLVERDDGEAADVAVLLERGVDLVRQDAARQPEMAVDRRQTEHRRDTPAAAR